MRYHDYEEKRRMKIIENDLKAELKMGIIDVFDYYGAPEKGKQLCDIFSTQSELQAGFQFTTELHIEMRKEKMETEKIKEENRQWQSVLTQALNSMGLASTFIYQNSKQIAA